MKFFIAFILLLIVGIGLFGDYFSTARAGDKLSINNNFLNKESKNELLNNQIIIKDINDKNELFSKLYTPVSKGNLSQEDLENYNQMVERYGMVTYNFTEKELEGYTYKGIKEYVKNNEPRFLVMIAHESCLSCGSILDLFLFKKLNNKYVLIAKTDENGIINGTPGTSDLVVESINNSYPVPLGKSDLGYIINYQPPVSGSEFTELSIIFLDEYSRSIRDIGNKIDRIQNIESDMDNDSFYYLDFNHSSHGLYRLHVYSDDNFLHHILADGKKLSPKNFHYTYDFDGMAYKLVARERNKYTKAYSQNYSKLYSSIDLSGYVFITYNILDKVLNDNRNEYSTQYPRNDFQWNYLFDTGVRFFKPWEKNNKYFRWKVRGVKLYGLNVIGIERTACDLSGEDNCIEVNTANSKIIFSEDIEVARNILKDNEGIQYRSILKNKPCTKPVLDQTKFEGQQRAVLELCINENFD